MHYSPEEELVRVLLGVAREASGLACRVLELVLVLAKRADLPEDRVNAQAGARAGIKSHAKIDGHQVLFVDHKCG